MNYMFRVEREENEKRELRNRKIKDGIIFGLFITAGIVGIVAAYIDNMK